MAIELNRNHSENLNFWAKSLQKAWWKCKMSAFDWCVSMWSIKMLLFVVIELEIWFILDLLLNFENDFGDFVLKRLLLIMWVCCIWVFEANVWKNWAIAQEINLIANPIKPQFSHELRQKPVIASSYVIATNSNSTV